ncbi:hypothetical protein PAXRUDRAFT_462425 [Paxillus rubicundulus Ve08.2h10]|uniref:Uncharacterized protein n=1 Tax=Paxillus rubicundulus Ve08.2h10 TaxID=930991 RepID=A0A0D0E6V1_9AGAM|nr:hypothetical protein PAXRUDRAFT_462425 [Paxillus rubicundulus Ve08.2h10]
MASLRLSSTLLANPACRRLMCPMKFPAIFVRRPHPRGLHKSRHMSIFSGVRGLFHRTSRSELPENIPTVPFYELAKPPLPIRLTWLFLFLDVVFTFAFPFEPITERMLIGVCRGTGAMLVWRYWTQRVDTPGDAEGDALPTHELRPVNQRLAFSFLHLAVGSLVALRLLNQRRSHVRKLWLFPVTVPGRYRTATIAHPLDTVVVDTYSLFNPRADFTLERSAYRFTGHKEDVILRLTPPGEQQDGFVLITKGVLINGQPVSREEALRIILDPFEKLKKPAAAAKAKGQVSSRLFTKQSCV